MNRVTRVILGILGVGTGVAIAAFSTVTLDLSNMVGGFGLLIAGTVILMDGLL